MIRQVSMRGAAQGEAGLQAAKGREGAGASAASHQIVVHVRVSARVG